MKILNLLLEGVYNSKATKKAIEKIINSNSQFKFKLQTAPNRLGNLDKISSDQFISDVLIPIFNIKKDDIVITPPGVSPNTKKDSPKGSTKYNMYEFPTDIGEARILLSGGMNIGQKYEEDFIDKLKSSAGSSIKTIEDPQISDFFKKMKIDPKKLKSSDITSEGQTNVNRSPNLDGPKEVGPTIADIKIMYDKKPIYISLKNKSGGVLYNGQSIPFIQEKNDKIVFNSSKVNDNPIISDIVEALKIDVKQSVNGLNAYLNQKQFKKKEENLTNSINKKLLLNIIASSIGYGYYYVREEGNSVKVIPILQKQDALDFVGNIESVTIRYPYYESKAKSAKTITVVVITNSSILGKTKFLVEFRNAFGKIVPLGLKVSAFYSK